MIRPPLRLKKGEEYRVRSGHPWIFSNEVNTKITPLKNFQAGQEVIIETHRDGFLGSAYVNPHSLIAARVFSYHPDQLLDSSFLTEKLSLSLALRQQVLTDPYYRLVFSEADGLPGVVIDRYGQDLALQINTAGMECKQALLQDAIQSIIPNINSILLRNDNAIRSFEALPLYVKPLAGTPPSEIQLEENGLPFLAPYLTGQKTGWFYDHRMNRARLKNYVSGRRILDVFSYVGAFGIHAACYGADRVTCIESSALSARYIEKNAALNQVGHKIDTICDDAFDALKKLLQEKKNYDVIILDPPAFIKKLKDRKEGLIAYQRINEMAIKLLAPQGVLVSCSCSMHLSYADLLALIQRIGYRLALPLQIIERGHQGPDHPIHPWIIETDYLKAMFVRKMAA